MGWAGWTPGNPFFHAIERDARQASAFISGVHWYLSSLHYFAVGKRRVVVVLRQVVLCQPALELTRGTDWIVNIFPDRQRQGRCGRGSCRVLSVLDSDLV